MPQTPPTNPPQTCCDMRGYLSFTILWLLKKKPLYGQELSDELERMRGTKPNPGTIYPALKELEKQGSITAQKEGRRKVYMLTEQGRKGVDEACEYFCSTYCEIFEEYSNRKQQ